MNRYPACCPPNTAPTRLSTTASIAGAVRAFGWLFSKPLLAAQACSAPPRSTRSGRPCTDVRDLSGAGAQGRMGRLLKTPVRWSRASAGLLSRYTHRVAISNSTSRDYRTEGNDRYKLMTLATDEFISRFLSMYCRVAFTASGLHSLMTVPQLSPYAARASKPRASYAEISRTVIHRARTRSEPTRSAIICRRHGRSIAVGH
jgi:hypothetical protein